MYKHQTIHLYIKYAFLFCICINCFLNLLFFRKYICKIHFEHRKYSDQSSFFLRTTTPNPLIGNSDFTSVGSTDCLGV